MEMPLENQLNHNEPHIMHVDLNSCFATIEQQANPLLRGKPLVVVPFISTNAVVIAPSIEAKRLGIKTGFSLRDAKLICKDLLVRVSDPPKYRDVHFRFRRIFRDYSPNVYPKSIDEAIIDFTGTKLMLGLRTLPDIGMEIKKRMKDEIGEWVTCNIGISTNLFLAKLAASLHKPDGLDVITHKNLMDIYKALTLTDLNGIAERFQSRLNVNGIFTPMQFLTADKAVLQKQVFKSIVGSYWYSKLRGYESDPFEYARGSFGRQYALQRPTAVPTELSARLMKLCEGAGRKMRRAGYAAYGVHVACEYKDHTSWHTQRTVHTEMFSLMELFEKAQWVLNMQTQWKPVTRLGVSFFDVIPSIKAQMTLFDEEPTKQRKVAAVMDNMNDRYGEYTLIPASMMGLQDEAVDRVPFGGVKDIVDVYEEADADEGDKWYQSYQ